MEKLVVLMLSGMTNGSVYGLVGLSLSLIYVSSRIINFAQGEFVMIGAMSTVFFLVALGLPTPISVLASVVLGAAVAFLLERFVYVPLVRRADPLTVMIGTFAAAVVIAGAALVAWGPNQLFVPNLFSLDPISLGVVTTTAQQIAIIAAFALLIVLTWWILFKTNFGLTVRAVGVNPTVARLMGIRSERIVRFCFLFSAAVSVVAGILIGPLLGGQASMGVLLSVKGFMAAILGGLGSPFAAAAGGLLIGILEALVGGYANSLYAEPIIFALILIVLLVKPYGLLGEFEAVQR
ncbi:branched-chain amino acid ABC transporter permease [Microvirga massiliensis]|uniref:branched-chain amino acid ABC transporter permease n=1 Tax=Microvirga massiliensis TaxID=1033741 RepID=UPI00062B7E4A|nr:branched-chain amino acid ABC transporter permease [Microvirga massiliensis]